MKNTTSFRKKALLSSLAMLMVALIALSSATFAWFTSNPNATASGLQLKATASKGLTILTDSHGATGADFSHDSYLNCNDTGTGTKQDIKALTPVSFDLTGNALGAAYTVDAAAPNAPAAAATNKVSDAKAGTYLVSGDYYTEGIACKLTGASSDSDTAPLKLAGLTITTKDVPQKSSIRVAVEYKPNGGQKTLVGVYSVADVSNNYLVPPAQNYTSGTTTYSLFSKDEYDFVPGPNATNSNDDVTIGTVGTSGSDKITVTVYLDGEDSNCYTDQIKPSEIVTEIKLDLTVAE